MEDPPKPTHNHAPTLLWVADQMHRFGGEVQCFAGPRAADLWAHLLRLYASDVCHEHEAPRGDCDECVECPACEVER